MSKAGRPKKSETDKAKPNERVTCDICGVEFVRSNRSSHKLTKFHKVCQQVDEETRQIIVDLYENA